MKRLKKIPKFKDEDAEREFWSNADSTEYIDWSKAQMLLFRTFANASNDLPAIPGVDDRVAKSTQLTI
jgi:hypothetical protein